MRAPIFVATITLLVGCAGGPTKDKNATNTQSLPTAAAASGLPDRDPQLARKLVEEGAVLIDVRTQKEWDAGHVDGATLLPVEQFSDRLSEVEKLTAGDKDKPVVLYCRSGGRAGRAKTMLLEAGYTQVTNAGGYKDWPKDAAAPKNTDSPKEADAPKN